LPSTFLPLQLAGDWYSKDMARVGKKIKVFGFEVKFKVIPGTEYGKKKAGVCWKVGLVNSTIQKICKNRTRIISALNITDRELNDFESLSEEMSIRQALLKWF
jgi:hypothetical protein